LCLSSAQGPGLKPTHGHWHAQTRQGTNLKRGDMTQKQPWFSEQLPPMTETAKNGDHVSRFSMSVHKSLCFHSQLTEAFPSYVCHRKLCPVKVAVFAIGHINLKEGK